MNRTLIAVLVASLTTFACATNAPVDDGTTITDARVSRNASGGVTVSGEGGQVDVSDPSGVITSGGADESGLTPQQRVGCEISQCDSCTCYPDGKCICMNCKCLSR